MHLLPPLLLLAALTTAQTLQYLHLGTYKFSPPLPPSNLNLSISSSQHIIAGPASPSFPLSFPTSTPAQVTLTSPSRPGYLALVPSGTTGYYLLKWKTKKLKAGEKKVFVATSCICGGNCGGSCVVFDIDLGTEWTEAGRWVIEDVGGGVWRVGWWDATVGAGDPALLGVILWRSAWV